MAAGQYEMLLTDWEVNSPNTENAEFMLEGGLYTDWFYPPPNKTTAKWCMVYKKHTINDNPIH